MIAEDPGSGLVEIARPVGVVAAITPSTNPAATPANNIINALKGRNAIILAPSPKGASTLALLLEYVHAELDRVGAPRDLVQMLPVPVTREATFELMRAGGPRRRDRLADQRARGVFERHAGDRRGRRQRRRDRRRDRGPRGRRGEDRTLEDLRQRDVVLVGEQRDRGRGRSPTRLLAAFEREGGVLLDAEETRRLESEMFPRRQARAGSDRAVGAGDCRARRARPPRARGRAVPDRRGDGRRCRASVLGREALAGARVLPRRAISRRRRRSPRGCSRTGRGPLGWSAHARSPNARSSSGSRLPVCRVIVNQAHCFATGGSFDNALPFSLSMGCGTLGRQQHLRQPQLPAFPQHHARRDAARPRGRARTDRRRDLRGVPAKVPCLTRSRRSRRSATRSTGTRANGPTRRSSLRPSPIAS